MYYCMQNPLPSSPPKNVPPVPLDGIQIPGTTATFHKKWLLLMNHQPSDQENNPDSESCKPSCFFFFFFLFPFSASIHFFCSNLSNSPYRFFFFSGVCFSCFSGSVPPQEFISLKGTTLAIKMTPNPHISCRLWCFKISGSRWFKQSDPTWWPELEVTWTHHPKKVTIAELPGGNRTFRYRKSFEGFLSWQNPSFGRGWYHAGLSSSSDSSKWNEDQSKRQSF